MELEVRNVSKLYNNIFAVRNVNLCMKKGIYGLLGANGAGKSTLMSMISSIEIPDSGDIIFNGENIVEMGDSYRALIGYMPQDFGFYKEFCILDFLRYIALLKGITRNNVDKHVNNVLRLVNLEKHTKKYFYELSGGMKKRVGIAQALLGEPQIIILDEPTAGLDPKERVRLRNTICDIAVDRIVVISTHILSDIEYISNRLLIMESGKLKDVGDLEQAFLNIEGKVWECKKSVLTEEIIRNSMICNTKVNNDGEQILRIINDIKPVPSAIRVRETLEDLYLYFVGEKNEFGNV